MLQTDKVIDESLDIMHWILNQADPEGLTDAMTDAAHALIDECDGPFKTALDFTKYAVRHLDVDPRDSRANAATFIAKLDKLLDSKPWLLAHRPSMADLAILPFVRQFAHTDLAWWDSQPYPYAQNWLATFKKSDRFAAIMTKYPPWKAGGDVVLFP